MNAVRRIVIGIILGIICSGGTIYARTAEEMVIRNDATANSVSDVLITPGSVDAISGQENNFTIELIENDDKSVSPERRLTVATGFNIPLNTSARGLSFAQQESHVDKLHISDDVVVYNLFVEDDFLKAEISHKINPTVVLFEKTATGTNTYLESNTIMFPVIEVAENRYEVSLFPIGALPPNATHIGLRAHKTNLLNANVDFTQSGLETMIFKLPEA